MPQLSTYLGFADHAEKTLADSLRAVAAGHGAEIDMYYVCQMLAQWSDHHREHLAPPV